MFDKRSVDAYRANVLGARAVIPQLLQRFEKAGVQCTWATVGLLFPRNQTEVQATKPTQLPTYKTPRFSPYPLLETIGEDEVADPFHYAGSLLKQIHATPGQEVGTHTFCHYYCLEAGQTPAQFAADVAAAVPYGIELASIVFPRNQVSPPYLEVCRQAGITAYRGTERAWFLQAVDEEGRTPVRRAIRLADHYLPLSGTNSARRRDLRAENGLVNIPQSRFLRPVSNRLSFLEGLRLRRITSEMTYAARTGRVFHLWWHPHNFGKYSAANLHVLDLLLTHYRKLQHRYGMESLHMGALATEVLAR